MVIEGSSGRESRRMGGRKGEGGGKAVGMNDVCVAVQKASSSRLGRIAMSGNARLSIRNHGLLIGPITEIRAALQYYYSPTRAAREY